MVKSMIISFSRKKYILQWIKVDFYLHMLLPIVFRIKISISRSHLEKCQKLESEKNIANQFISNMRVFLIHYHYIWFEMPLLGSAWTRMGPTTSCPQIPSAIIGVIGVFGSGVGYLLPGKGIKESLHWKEFLSPNPRFLFLPMPTEITAWGYFPLHQPPPSERNCIDLFYLLLPYASSYLSCKWKWDPKLQQMGPCHWMQMFSAPRPEYTCPVKLTLTPLPTEQTALLQTLHSSNLFWVEAQGTTVCPHVVNKKW